MTLPTAFLVGPDPLGGAETGVDAAVVDRQLAELGFAVYPAEGAADGLAAAIRIAPTGQVALVDRRFIGHLHALRRAVCDTRGAATAAPGVLMAVTSEARAALITEVAAGVEEDYDTEQLTEQLERAVRVRRFDPAPLVAAVGHDSDERAYLTDQLIATDEDKVRFEQARKRDDTIFTTFCVRPYTTHLARLLDRYGIRPNHVTVVSLLIALGAALSATAGARSGWIASALLIHIGFVLDCVDGDLARYSVCYTKLGAWLDLTFDRVKEYAVFAGLAVGAVRAGDSETIWVLAAGAMAFQTVRHHLNSCFDAASVDPHAAPAEPEPARSRRERWTRWGRRLIVWPMGERLALTCLLIAFTTPRLTLWVLLAIGVPALGYSIAGRLRRSLARQLDGYPAGAPAIWALTDVGPLGRLIAGRAARALPLLILAAVGLALVLATWLGAPSWWLAISAVVYAVAAGLSITPPLAGWSDWLRPPVFRAVEYSAVIGAAFALTFGVGFAAGGAEAEGLLPAAFAYVAACAFHHYDTVYRLGGAAPRRWLGVVSGGHEARLVLLALLGLGGPGVLRVGLAVLAVALAIVYLTENIASWIRPGPPRATGDSTSSAGRPPGSASGSAFAATGDDR